MSQTVYHWVRAAALGAALAANPAQASVDSHASAEAKLQRTLELLRAGKRDEALREIERLLERHPNFRLAHLIRGDLLLARARDIGEPGAGAGRSERLTELRAELRARSSDHHNPPPQGHLPRHILRLDPAQKHAIVVDTRRARVFVYENANGAPRFLRDYYSTIGKQGWAKEREGDKKTPVGAYFVTSHIPGKKLPDFYGWGAFPLNYPNELDRRQGRTGYGIWIHGVPSDTYARSPLASDGCVVLANPEIAEIAAYVKPGVTPVVITEGVEWLPAETWRSEAEEFSGVLEQWRRDWESRDVERYLGHYARTFRADGFDYAAWGAHKRRVTSAKKWIKLDLNSVSVLRSPGTPPAMVVTFDQDYRSNAVSQRSRKRQYWIREDGRWKIAYEAQLKNAPLALPESFIKRSQD